MIPGAAPVNAEALGDFYPQVLRAFCRAASQCGTLSRQFLLAGRTLRLEFAGPAMLPCVVPALEHLPAAMVSAADLRVCIFDSASTGVALPAAPWGNDAMVSRCEIHGLGDIPDVKISLQPGSAALTVYHPSSATALLWMADARDCPSWEAAAPLRGLLHWWCAEYQQQLVHAAAIADTKGALLLTGKGGSGKSTTALAALVGGMRYLGDDYVVCENGANGPMVHSLYNTAKLDRSSLELLPALAAAVEAPPPAGQDKSVIYTSRSFPSRLAHSLPLRACVLPAVTTGAPELVPIAPATAFLALAPTTLFQLPGAGSATASFLRQLVMTLPCYQLALGSNPQAAVAVLADLLAGAR